MSPDVLTELVAKITADATELKKGLGEATTGVQSWVKENEKQFKAVGAVLTGIGAAITGSLGMMTKAAIDEEVNVKRLGVALKGVGVNYDDVKDSLEGVILATQKKTGIADDQQRDVLGRLILVTKDYDKALSLLPLVLDLAAAGQMDATTAATYLAKAYEDLEGQAGKAKLGEEMLGKMEQELNLTRRQSVIDLAKIKEQLGETGEGTLEYQQLLLNQEKIQAKLITTESEYVLAQQEVANATTEIGIRLGQATVKFKNLDEVQKLVGGTAEATANPLNVLKASMGDLAEKIGSFLIPVLKGIVDKIVPIIEKVQAWTDAHPELTKVLIILAAVLGGVALVLGPILIMLPMLVASFGLLLGPIGLVVAAVMGLIAIGTLLVLNWEAIKTKTAEIWNSIVSFLKGIWDNIVGFFKENWDKILTILFPGLGLPLLIARNWGSIVDVIKNIWNQVINWLKGVPERIGEAFNPIKDFILAPFRVAWQGIETGINWLIRMLNSISFIIPDWVPIIGGRFFGINIPEVTLPTFATGGIVTQPTLAMVGESGAEAIIPLNEAGDMGNITINFTQPVFFDREDTMNKFVDMIRKGIQRQDRIRFGGAYSGG